MLERLPYQDNPPRSDYRLTDKGWDLFPVLVARLDNRPTHEVIERALQGNDAFRRRGTLGGTRVGRDSRSAGLHPRGVQLPG